MARPHLRSAAPPGMLRMLIATLVLMALVLGPVWPLAAMGAASDQATSFPICHAVDADADQAPAKAPGHGKACQLCPACHLAAQPGLVPAHGAAVERLTVVRTADRPSLRSAVGPTGPVRAATPPTGPPSLPV